MSLQTARLLGDGPVEARVVQLPLGLDGGEDDLEPGEVAAGGAISELAGAQEGRAEIGVCILPGGKPGKPGRVIGGGPVVPGVAIGGDEFLPRRVVIGGARELRFEGAGIALGEGDRGQEHERQHDEE